MRVESDIYDPTGVNVAGLSQIKTIYGSQDDPVTLSLNLPTTGMDGIYAVESLVFDDATGTLQSSCRTSIDVGPLVSNCIRTNTIWPMFLALATASISGSTSRTRREAQ